MEWGWYTCPVYDSCPYTREFQSLMQQEEVGFGGGLVTFVLLHHFLIGDVSHDLMHHLPSLFFPPILDLPLSLPDIHLY